MARSLTPTACSSASHRRAGAATAAPPAEPMLAPDSTRRSRPRRPTADQAAAADPSPLRTMLRPEPARATVRGRERRAPRGAAATKPGGLIRRPPPRLASACSSSGGRAGAGSVLRAASGESAPNGQGGQPPTLLRTIARCYPFVRHASPPDLHLRRMLRRGMRRQGHRKRVGAGLLGGRFALFRRLHHLDPRRLEHRNAGRHDRQRDEHPRCGSATARDRWLCGHRAVDLRSVVPEVLRLHRDHAGEVCTGGCTCGGAVINVSEEARYNQAIAGIQSEGCPCPPPGMPTCVQGTCTTCTPGFCQ